MCLQSGLYLIRIQGSTAVNKQSILVIEENPTWRKVISLLAEEFGFSATIVSTCEEGWQQVKDGDKFALVLVGVRLANQSCDRYLGQLLEVTQNQYEIPVVGMSAYLNADDRQSCLKAGFDDHLAKPFSAQEFRDMIFKWCKNEVRDNVLQFRPTPWRRSAEES